MSNKIGFTNFRQFSLFNKIEFQPITFLVGSNNTGKSTFVKAILLVIDYLKNDFVGQFSFNENNLEDVNIVTYDRALYKLAEINMISFSLEIGHFNFLLNISGERDTTSAVVILLEIEDSINKFKFIFKPQISSISILSTEEKNQTMDGSDVDILTQLQNEEKVILEQIRLVQDKLSTEYIELNEKLIVSKKKISGIRSTIKEKQIQGSFELTTTFNSTNFKDIFNEAITEFVAEYEMQYHDIQKGKKPKKTFEAFKAFKDNKFKIEKSISEFLLFQQQAENFYLGASLSKQSAIFAIRDRKNPLAQAIHDFKQLGIDKDEKSVAYNFVQYWMGDEGFNIGKNFKIEMHAGEAYEFVIKNETLEIPLADKGKGSIQAMLLILRLATIIHKKIRNNKLFTVVIEEPELNLHPAFQSKLAVLFLEVYNNFGINFIIETHSEYMIRKTQLLVKNSDNVSDNTRPFSVIYFDKNLEQWNMRYREDGKFIEEFGSGFFDESKNIIKQML